MLASSKKGMEDLIKIIPLKDKVIAPIITKIMETTTTTTIKTVTINQTIKIVNKLDEDSHKFANVRNKERITINVRIIENKSLFNHKIR